jgi:DNA ligase-1
MVISSWRVAAEDRAAGDHARRGGADRARPPAVVDIALDGAQRSVRYPGGVALRFARVLRFAGVLRFARVLRYRPDKTPAEADTIEAVRAPLAGAADQAGGVPESAAVPPTAPPPS